MPKPCTNTTCGSYNPSLKNNCRHGFKDFKTFDCLGYVAEKDAWDKIVDRMEGEVPKNGK